MSPKNLDVKLPSVSVVIPVLNEAKTIHRCLESLLSQRYPVELLEVIVVDNNSTDGTVAAVSPFRQVKVLHESTPGVGAARATGWAQATGELVASTDGDCVLPPDWIQTMVTVFLDDPNTVALGGGYDFYGRGKLFGLFSYGVELILIHLSYFLSGGIVALTGNNMAVRRANYLAVGCFNKQLRFGEDMDLGRRLHYVGKVRWLYHSRILTSPRRYSGFYWLIGIIPYLWNFITMSATNHAWRNHLQNLRD